MYVNNSYNFTFFDRFCSPQESDVEDEMEIVVPAPYHDDRGMGMSTDDSSDNNEDEHDEGSEDDDEEEDILEL